ncbi:Penicillin-binding protein activator LpoA precursor [Legionella massiliensis]|uniref:Penicillin-binding protein activator LpoA n=1 Tax=Legionella massiliensis TaxID=1034943 RepID=A0A078KWP4_9GAMM|nr:penicillin-binding protein activator [Legionella massiliensis]CDZ76174.1 Penicillin-binding protein activator LpoA precursor [Legionella massiliensis]CEE11912.1 Penicillin-binding protein activator LpoA precursor [Legionella massiliensis]
MLANSPVLKVVSIIVSAFLLSQCAKVIEPQLQPIVNKEQSKAEAVPFTMPATTYLALARNQADEEKSNLLIMAAGRFIYDGQWRDGIRTLAQTTNLSPEQASAKTILLAKTDIIRDQPKAAISRLAGVHEISSLSPFYQVQYHETLALAYESVGNPAESVVERIKLERLIPDEAGQTNNRRILWLTLTKLPVEELNTLAVEAPESSELQGWMKLALVAREKNANVQETYAQVEQWQSTYSEHPANKLLPSPLASVKPYLHANPKQVALLLPLSGPLAGPGGAIRDGFMAASANTATKVRLYDTAATNVSELYQQAISEGADYVVGPLTKNDVATVAAAEHPVPTLLLNDVDTSGNPNAYHFGLSPTNEARQVAARAGKKGYKRALVIAPAGTWGDEIVAAFTAQWRNNGGTIVDKLAYGNSEDLNVAVRNLLHVSESQAREKQVKQLLGRNIQTIQRRRQDFDMIFLLAYPTKARQIMPLLRYYFAGNVPVYATSTVYGGSLNIMKDKDLDGIIFSDMPWVFNHQAGNKNWPEQLNSYNRLYALGMDSYTLSTQLNQLLLFPAMGMDDKSGVLYLNRAQQIARIPAWGQFRGGVAVATSIS